MTDIVKSGFETGTQKVQKRTPLKIACLTGFLKICVGLSRGV